MTKNQDSKSMNIFNMKIKQTQKMCQNYHCFHNFGSTVYRYILAISIMIILNCTGHGRVTVAGIRVVTTSYLADPPAFILYANSSGGPPTTNNWARNGALIRIGDPFSTQLMHRCPPFGDKCVNSVYESELLVIGILPGEYRYRVSNRDSSISFRSIQISRG